MNGVLGMTGLLLDTPLTSEQRELAQTAYSSAESLLAIINDILDTSKIESGKLRLDHVSFHLDQILEGAIESLAERAYSKGVEFSIIDSPGLRYPLMGDPGRIRQILSNLLSNAVKFTEQGEVVLQIALEEETPTHVSLKFEVTDTGIGISKEAQSHLFQPFSQGDSSNTRSYGGTGLGLAISKQLVEMMNGRIGMHSTPGQGSTFWFTLPLEKAPQTPPPESASPSIPPWRTLIIEDHSMALRSRLDFFQSLGLPTTPAATSAEGLLLIKQAAALQNSYQLIVLDSQMADTDGLSLATHLLQDPQLAPEMIILLTPLGHSPSTSGPLHPRITLQTKPLKRERIISLLASELQPRRKENAKLPASPLAPAGLSHPWRILLVEDDAVNRKVTQLQMRKLGYRIECVENGQMALEAFGHSPYDIILMDCQMPGMDGYQTARTIRQREAQGAVTRPYIIAMTACALPDEKAKALECGMDDYLSKPTQLPVLEQALQRAGKVIAAHQPLPVESL